MNRFVWTGIGLLVWVWGVTSAAQETSPLAASAAAEATESVTVPAKPASPNAKVPREVDLDIRLIEIRKDLKLPLADLRTTTIPQSPSTTLGRVLTKEEASRVIESCQADRSSNILFAPRLRLIPGQQGQLRSGREIVLESPKSSQAADDTSPPAVQKRFVGTAIDATVTVTKPGLLSVSLMCDQSSSSSENVPVGESPRIHSRRVETVVELASGQTMLLRGLQGNRTTASVTRVPVLGDLPVIGDSLFSRKRTETEKTELMLLITPTAIDADGN